MKQLNRATANVEKAYPERVLQFGGGNFLRGFADWMLDVYNEKTKTDLGVLVVSLIGKDNYKTWQEQDGLYHVLTRGVRNGQLINENHLVKSISRIMHLFYRWEDFLQSAEDPNFRFIISNTTEAGIRFSPDDKITNTPPKEFPAKLTLWLYRRYQHFNGSHDAGCIFLPVELIMNNGAMLRQCILQNIDNWGLEEEFKDWINKNNIFCNTLVDRIVPGVNRDKLSEEWEEIGFQDSMMTEGEPFHFWAIEAPQVVREELPLDKAGLNVIFTDDLSPYRKRKVRILNGAHTSMVPVAYLYGLETVREAVEDEVVGQFIHWAIFQEIIPSLDSSDQALRKFAEDVIDRFKNPFIKHQLISIALNSSSKFETRVLPSILAYEKQKGQLPEYLVFSMAAFIHFYKGESNGNVIPLKDDQEAISFLDDLWNNCDGSILALEALVQKVLGWKYVWKKDLSEIDGLKQMLTDYLKKIETEGFQKTLRDLIIKSY